MPEDLVHLAVRAAQAGGAELLTRRREPAGVTTKTASGDLVSDADHASEDAIVAVLTAARPDDGVLGEEGASREAPSGVRWVVDPLDGTTNYLYGLDGWAVSVAAERRIDTGWQAVAGVVHDPVRGETAHATAGGGAWLDGRRLRVRDPVALEHALIGTGFSYDRETRRHQGAVVARLLPRARDVRRIGAAALDLTWLAAGRMDAFYESDLQPWDIAAGLLIAREAGAVATSLGKGVVAAGPALHAPLADLVAG